MQFSKPEKMSVLEMIRSGETVPAGEKYSCILFDLLEDHMIANGGEGSSMYITYFGFKQLESWDPVLQVTVNHQLLERSHGDA